MSLQIIANISSAANAEQDVKQKLIKKILENMAVELRSAPSKEASSTIVASAKEKVKAIAGDDSTYAQFLGSLDLLIKENTPVNSTETDTTVSIRTSAHRMKAAISTRNELGNSAPNGLGNAPSQNGGGSDLPTPPLPPSGCPDYDDLSSSDINNWISHTSDEQIESALMRYYEYLTGPGKTDPTGLAKLMNFIAFLSSHKRPDGSPLINQKISDFIDKNCNLTGSDGTSGGIALWVRQMADYAFAAGYKGLIGDAARQAWIHDEQAAWSQIPSNKWTESVQKCLGKPSITDDPNLKIDGSGNVIYTYDGFTYYWNKTDGSPINDRDVIMSIFNGHSQENEDGSVTQDPFYTQNVSSMEKAYRISMLNDLLKEFKDPIWAVMIFFMQSTDGQFQAQMSGHAREEDDVSEWQKYASTLSAAIQKFQSGTGTADDARNFAKALYGAKVFVDEHPSLFGLDSTFKTNVFDMIGNIQGGSGSLILGSIKDLITKIDAGNYDNLARDLNTTFSSTPPASLSGGPTPTPPTPNNNAQIAVNAENTFASEATGMSKTQVTVEAQDSATEAALNKVGGDMDQLYATLGKAFCGNQKTA